jgi:hypothetical protein
MPEQIQLKILTEDAPRIIEALSCYLESWRETEGYWRHGVIYDGPIHSDCNDAETAGQCVKQLEGILKRFQTEVQKSQ